jgi:hypothetical protein
MRRDIDYTDYDPARFIEDHPNDPNVRAALHAAAELAIQTEPPRADETPLEARHRLEQGFDALITQTDKDLDQFHQGERTGRQEQFVKERQNEIRERGQSGIEATPHLGLKVGGQKAREDQLRHFQQNISENQELKQEMEQLSHYQGARSEAISHAIAAVRDEQVKRYGLEKADRGNADREQAERAMEFKAPLEPPRPQTGPSMEPPQGAPFDKPYKPWPGESAQEAQQRTDEAMPRRLEREQREATLKDEREER